MHSLIDDENRMFKLRAKKKRIGLGGICLPANDQNEPSAFYQKYYDCSISIGINKQLRKNKMKLLGKQLTLMRELKELEKDQKETKINTLARRDNERAIKLLKQRMAEERHKHEYHHSKILAPTSERKRHSVRSGYYIIDHK